VFIALRLPVARGSEAVQFTEREAPRIAAWFGESSEKTTAPGVDDPGPFRLRISSSTDELPGECVESATAHRKPCIQLRTSGESIRIE
jgi:hypothetical protein